MKELTELVELAKKATSGKWIADSGEGWDAIISQQDMANANFIIGEFIGPDSKANKEFVSAANPETILAIAEAFRALQQERDELLHKLAELEKQKPVLYALRFKNSRGQPEKLINENCLFRDKEKAAAYGLGGNYVTQESGKIEWVPDPALNPEVIPLFTRPAPAINLAELVPDEALRELDGVIDWIKGLPIPTNSATKWLIKMSDLRDAILCNIEEQSQ